jgi:hypothetical protein
MPYAPEYGLSNAVGQCVTLPVGHPELGGNREMRIFRFIGFCEISNPPARHRHQWSHPWTRTDPAHNILPPLCRFH